MELINAEPRLAQSREQIMIVNNFVAANRFLLPIAHQAWSAIKFVGG